MTESRVEAALRLRLAVAQLNLNLYLEQRGESVGVTQEEKASFIRDTLRSSTAQLLELFEYEHLPEHLQKISKPFHDLAWDVAHMPTQRGAEQTTCLRKLLEAKDCAVRMGVPLGKIGNNSPPLPVEKGLS